MEYRKASPADVELLAHLNQQLIRDEGHRNPMTVATHTNELVRLSRRARSNDPGQKRRVTWPYNAHLVFLPLSENHWSGLPTIQPSDEIQVDARFKLLELHKIQSEKSQW